MSSDDGYREIQLNGKQLIFLFMATTIVAVVIFLCGVTVGRGVRNASPVAAVEQSTAAAPPIDVAAVPGEAPASNKPVAGPPPAAVPPTPAEPEAPSARSPEAAPADKAVPQKAEPVAGDKGRAAQPAPATNAASTAPAPTSSPAAGAGQGLGEPAGEGYVVQVAAFSDRVQAEARARSLLARGYNAFIVAPPAAGGMFRVRVGKFKERRQAEAALRRLAKEEKIKPFIPTR